MHIIQQGEDLARAKLVGTLSSYAFNVEIQDIFSATRGVQNVAFARQVAMYLAHTLLEMSFARVANIFGRDRSTVVHACHIVEDKRDDREFDAFIEALEDAVLAAPCPLSRVTGLIEMSV